MTTRPPTSSTFGHNAPQRGRAFGLVGGRALWILLALLARTSSADALDVPDLAGHINDHASLLAHGERTALESKLSEYEKQTGHQFAVLIVPTLAGEPIERFSIRVAERWKLGSERYDDGLILIVARHDRAMRIETGYGLEGAIPDAVAARLIREFLAPAFRQGQFALGIDAALSRAMELGKAERASSDSQQQRSTEASPERLRQIALTVIIILSFIALVAVVGMLAGIWDRRRAAHEPPRPRRPSSPPVPSKHQVASMPMPTPPRRRESNESAGAVRPTARHRRPSWPEENHWVENSPPRAYRVSTPRPQDDSDDDDLIGGGGAFGGGGASGSW